MPSLSEILQDPNYVSANEATKQAIFDKYSATDANFTGANAATQDAIRQRFGVAVAPQPDELGRYVANAEPARKEATVGSQFIGGVKQVGADYQAFLDSLASHEDANKAAIALAKRQQEIEKEVGHRPGLKDVGKAYGKSGILGAAGEVLSQSPGAIAASGPQMGTTIAGNVAGAAAGSAIFPGIGTVLGGYAGGFASLFPQFYAENLASQAQEAIEKGEPVDVNRGSAAAAAAGQAALEEAGTVYAYGKNFLKGIFGKVPTTAAEKAIAEKVLVETAKSTIKSVATGAGKVALEESFVNPAQDILDRWQSGQDLFSKEALEGYGEAVYGSLLQSPLGGLGGYKENRAARKELRNLELDKREQEDQDLKDRARFNELEAKSKGTSDTFATDENGNTVKVKGTLGQYFTPEEQKEYQGLREKFGPKQEAPAASTTVPASESHDTQAMHDELGGKDITQPVEQPAPRAQAPAMDMQPMVAATTNLTHVLQQATVGYNIALNKMTGAEQTKTLNQVKTYLTTAFGNFLTPKQTEEYVNYLVNEGGLAESDMGTNHGLFGEAVNNFGGVKPPEKPAPKNEEIKPEPPKAAEPEATQEPEAPVKEAEAPAAVEEAPETVPEQPVESKGEPVAEPEKITKPDPKWDTVKTGQPVTLEMYQGRGEDKSKIYSGAQVAVGGEGQYYAPTGEDAANYGAVTKHEVTLNNPLVITNDDEWRALVKNPAVGWTYPNPFSLAPERVAHETQKLKDHITSLGHDGLVIKMDPRGDMAKTLRNVFGHDQAVSYKPQVAAKPQAKPAVPKLQVKHTEFEIDKIPKEIHDEVKDMTTGEQIANWLVDNAPNDAAKHIAQGILKKVKSYAKLGVPVRVTMLEGDKRNPEAYGSQRPVFAGTKFSHFDVKYNGLSSRGQADAYTGTDYETIMHEMAHMISTLQIHFLKQSAYSGDKAIFNELKSIRLSIIKRVKEELAKPRAERHPGMHNIKNALDIESIKDGKVSYGKHSLEEMFAYGLTQGPVRDFFATIPSGKTTVLGQLAKVFRKLLGINPKYQTALDRLSGVADYFINESAQDVNALVGKVGASLQKIDEFQAKINQPTNIRGEAVEPSWSLGEDSIKRPFGISDQFVDSIIYKLQDKHIDTKRVQEAITKEAGELDDKLNVYDKEQVYHGKVAAGIREFLLHELMPAVKEMYKLKISPKEIMEYLHNRHAEERNKRMNELNKYDPITGELRKTPWELQDRASGINTKDAQAYLSALPLKKHEALEKIAMMFDRMIRGTQQILVYSGVETQDTIDAWNSIFNHYVPLFRKENNFANKSTGGPGTSRGFAVSGKFSKRAMGSAKEVVDIMGSIIAQRERALVRAEKAEVGRSVYALALTNPNPGFWLPVNPDAIKNPKALLKEIVELGFDVDDAKEIVNNLMQEPKTRTIGKTAKIDPNTGLPTGETEEAVKLKADNLSRFGDNVFPVRINGKDRYVFFNKDDPQAQRMVAALKNMDVENMAAAMSMVGKATRWFANVNTQYNPIFGAVNLLRDLGGATLNLSTTPIADKKAKVLSQVMPAMSGIIRVLRDERSGKVEDYSDNKWAQAFYEFRQQGGQTGYRGSLVRSEQEKAIIEHELAKIDEGNTKKSFRYVLGALTDLNDMMENAVRVSAYQTAIDAGISQQKAAVIAKNITVNFDKKGQLSSNINALWAFFNASVQGTARLYQTLSGPAGKKIMAGGVLLGSMQAVMLALAGFRDDEPPEFVRERNFIIPLPNGKYFGIPYPLGFNVFPNAGRITTEFIIGGGKHPAKHLFNLTNSVLDAFNPLGSSTFLQTIFPTVLDPFVALGENKDAFGRPIFREGKTTNPTPGYTRTREGASAISKQLSYFLNLASGGSKYSKGFISPTGDEIDYLAGQVTGGLGREIMKVGEVGRSAATGEEVAPYKIPLVGRFYGDTKSAAAETSRFYTNITRMADYEQEIKGREKHHESVGDFYRQHPEARYWERANSAENEINALNKEKKELLEKNVPRERILRLEKQKVMKMKQFNDLLKKYE